MRFSTDKARCLSVASDVGVISINCTRSWQGRLHRREADRRRMEPPTEQPNLFTYFRMGLC